MAGIAIPLIAGMVAWLANEWRKRAAEDRNRREERYRLLLEHSRGFYIGGSPTDIAQFLAAVNLSWLYCPDGVIRALYTFLDTVHSATPTTEQAREEAFNQMVAAMRYDLRRIGPFKRTSLVAADYRHVGVTALQMSDREPSKSR
ncbi:MAG: hypothetical protein WEA80_11950 [Gemmatimonadaceae bacterium]